MKTYPGSSNTLKISEALVHVYERAEDIAAEYYHREINIHHLLLSLIRDELIGDIIESKMDMDGLDSNLESMIQKAPWFRWSEDAQLDPQMDENVERIINAAATAARQNDQRTLTPFDIMIAILQEPGNPFIMRMIDADISPRDFDEARTNPVANMDRDPSNENDFSQPKLPARTNFDTDIHNRTENFITVITGAAAGSFGPAFGIDSLKKELMSILLRPKSRSAVLIGPAGVGKTTIVESLAADISNRDVPPRLQGRRIYSLNMTDLVAGTKWRGDLEDRVKNTLERMASEGNAILFIDEIHMINGAGSSSAGMTVINMLKTSLSDGSLCCIGATTPEEYERHIAEDPAMRRRLSPLRVPEPTAEQTMDIIRKLRKFYKNQHEAVLQPDAIHAAVTWSGRYMPDLHFPDKAITVIDTAIGTLRSRETNKTPKGETVITRDDIAQVISKKSGVPLEIVTAAPGELLARLEPIMRDNILGQEKAIGDMIEIIETGLVSGIRDPKRPRASVMFAGPTGVGKTESAREIARALGMGFYKVNMTEYSEKHAVSALLGAPPGYTGFDSSTGFASEIRKNPYTVVLFDEIEKSHPDMHNLLLQLLDEGTLTPRRGTPLKFNHAIIVMTTNAGAADLSRNPIGFNAGPPDDKTNLDAVRKSFLPEFIGRIDQVISFEALTQETAQVLVSRELARYSKRLTEEKNYPIQLVASKKTVAALARESFNNASGARSLEKELQRKIGGLIVKNPVPMVAKSKADFIAGTIDMDQKPLSLVWHSSVTLPHETVIRLGQDIPFDFSDRAASKQVPVPV